MPSCPRLCLACNHKWIGGDLCFRDEKCPSCGNGPILLPSGHLLGSQKLSWTITPPPKDICDIGETHVASVNGRTVAKIRTGGRGSSVFMVNGASGELLHVRHESNHVPVNDIRLKVEDDLGMNSEPEAQKVPEKEPDTIKNATRMSQAIVSADLPDKWVRHMAKLPETGMGYHRVKCVVQGHKNPIPGIVINGSKLETVFQIDVNKLSDIQTD